MTFFKKIVTRPSKKGLVVVDQHLVFVLKFSLPSSWNERVTIDTTMQSVMDTYRVSKMCAVKKENRGFIFRIRPKTCSVRERREL